MSNLPKSSVKLIFVTSLFFASFFLLEKTAYAADSGICIIGKDKNHEACVSYTPPVSMLRAVGQCKREGAEEKEYTICCKTKQDTCSVYNLREPVCGSADTGVERMACGQEKWGLMCWGNNYRNCATDPDFPETAEGSENRTGYLVTDNNKSEWTENLNEATKFSGSILYNGIEYPVNGFVCFCDPAMQGGCGCPGLKTGSVDGEGESRLWFPHLKLLAALSTMAQSIFNPHPSSLANNTPGESGEATLTNPDVVTTKIAKHQGIDDLVNKTLTDGNLIVSKENNSSLVVGHPAPPAENLLKQTEAPYNDLACVLSEVENNPGDDLIGPEITARVMYTQEKDYEACPHTNCTPDGQTTYDPSTCCSQGPAPQCKAPYSKGVDESGNVIYTCGVLGPVAFSTKGRVSVFIKNPLIEYIYDAVVDGSQSLFARFMPQTAIGEYEEIPSSTTYQARAKNNNKPTEQSNLNIEIGNHQSGTPTFYLAHVGSLKKYWLEDFQKALRPLGMTSASADSGTDTSTTTTISEGCFAPHPDSAEFQNALTQAISRGQGASKVPKAVLEAIYRMEAYDYYYSSEPYDCTYTSYGMLGLMQISDSMYQKVVPADQQVGLEQGQCNKTEGKLNRCNLEDAIEIAARVLLLKVGEWPNGRLTGRQEIYAASRGYYESDCPDILTKNFARNSANGVPSLRGGSYENMGYADIVCSYAGFCPPWPDRIDNCSE